MVNFAGQFLKCTLTKNRTRVVPRFVADLSFCVFDVCRRPAELNGVVRDPATPRLASVCNCSCVPRTFHAYANLGIFLHDTHDKA